MLSMAIETTPHSVLEMRGHQRESFEAFQDAHYMLLVAPMGSGKTISICFTSADKMRRDPSLRTVIAVPQTIIADGFDVAHVLRMPDGTVLEWDANNLCGAPATNKVASVIDFLQSDNRILICTHATLVAVYRQLKASDQLDLFRNLLLWIDEAHHMRNSEIEGLDEIDSNGIGELVRMLSQNPTVQIGLATATPFRGDRLSIFGGMEDRFVQHVLPYDEYFKTLQYLKSFSFDFVLSADISVDVGKLALRARKDIVYIPSPQTKCAKDWFGCKKQQSEAIIAEYQKVHDGIRIDAETGLIILRKSGKPDFKIIDLVEEGNRQQKKCYINKIKHRDDLDLIIALGMFKEGANWIWADRAVIIGERNSLTDIVQTCGRTFRDAVGKERVEITQILPWTVRTIVDKDGLRDGLNSYLKAIFASLLFENVINPIKVVPSGGREKSVSGPRDPREDWLGYLGDKQPDVMQAVFNELINVWAKRGQDQTEDHLREEYFKFLPGILSSYGCTEHHREIGEQIWGILARKTIALGGQIDVSQIDFDILQKTNPIGFALHYTSGFSDITTFEALRSAISRRRDFLSYEEARDFVIRAGIKTSVEYFGWKERAHHRLPADPASSYINNGWNGWGEFLGSGRTARGRDFRSYEEAKAIVQEAGIKTGTEYDDWPERAAYKLPATPDIFYTEAEGWNGWKTFLGTDKGFPSYEEAKAIVQQAGIKTRAEYTECPDRRAANLPGDPQRRYKGNGWNGWGEFLGSSRRAPVKHIASYEEAKAIVQQAGITSTAEYDDWPERAAYKLPSEPGAYYKTKGWQGQDDFFATGWPSYNEAFDLVRPLNFKTGAQYKERYFELGLPRNPDTVYKNKGWVSWKVFLGKANT
jgi:hypothetical protein